MKYAMLLGLLAVGCGGAKPAESPDTGRAPKLPPSMGSGGAPGSGPAAGAGDMPSSNTAASDEVSKGMKALEANDTDGAKAYAQAALKKNAKDGEAMALLGMVAEKLNDKPGAEKAYREALKTRPDLEAAAVNLSAIYVEGEKWDDAEKVSRGGIERHKDNASLHLNLAIALAGKGDQAGSGKEFDEATRLAPNEPMFPLTYAHWLGSWKQVDAAAAKLRAARPLAGDNLGVLASIGHEMRLVGAFVDCVPTFDKAITLRDAAELRTERALCKLGAKDKAGALADLQAAVTKEPNFAPAHFYLGGRFAEGAKWKEAAAEYDAYVKLQANGPLAKQAQERARLAREKAAGKK